MARISHWCYCWCNDWCTDGLWNQDDFINEVGATIKPEGSALFLLIEKWTEDKALERLNKFNATIIRTSLTKEEEENLKVAFGAGE